MLNEKTQAALYSSLITAHSSLASDFQPRAVNLEPVEVAEGAEGERVGAEERGGDAQQVFGRDRFDARDDLVGRDAPPVDDLLARERAGARARGLQAQQDGRDGLILDEPQLLVADCLAQTAAQLGEREVEDFAEVFGRGARVDLEDARVREVAAHRADRVGQAALLAHALPQARARAAADDGAEEARRVA